jgi:hypothetical protein
MKYVVIFVLYGVEFKSGPESERVANEVIQKLAERGVDNAYKQEA